MKWIRTWSALAALFALASPASAGLFGGGSSCKSCTPQEGCGPDSCKPVIVRPCSSTIHTYQRACSTLKPPVCAGCPSDSCAPCADGSCAPEPTCGAPAGKGCCLGGILGGGNKGGCHDEAGCTPACEAPCTPVEEAPCCETAPTCAAPSTGCCLSGLLGGGDKGGCHDDAGCAPASEAPCTPVEDAPCCETAPTCAAPSTGCCLSGLLGGGDKGGCHDDAGCAPACEAPCAPVEAAPCCEETACGGDECPCADEDPCVLAKLIYTSMTACYADDREDAIDEIGDNYSCVCHPEIMNAFIYALNDADEDVRAQAADEIGDQINEYGTCCCSKEVIAALTQALADCDDDVVDQAEEALEACGYELIDGVCDESCTDGCTACGQSATSAPVYEAPTQEYIAPAAPAAEDAPGKMDVPPAPPAPMSNRSPRKSKGALASLLSRI